MPRGISTSRQTTQILALSVRFRAELVFVNCCIIRTVCPCHLHGDHTTSVRHAAGVGTSESGLPFSEILQTQEITITAEHTVYRCISPNVPWLRLQDMQPKILSSKSDSNESDSFKSDSNKGDFNKINCLFFPSKSCPAKGFQKKGIPANSFPTKRFQQKIFQQIPFQQKTFHRNLFPAKTYYTPTI